MDHLLGQNCALILDSMNDGLYVADLDRRIVYWNKQAERITGWLAKDVVGHRCLDDILCHIDKDGHRLCGTDHCPLHRAMITSESSTLGLIVFAQGRDGRRIPTQVSVAPLRDEAGRIVGGVETFREVTPMLHDLERAKAIQSAAMGHNLPKDPRITFFTHYLPRDIVGGDYYAIERLDEDRYVFLLADVMGHGVAAALYTMYISVLWDRHHALLANPPEFASAVNAELSRALKDEGSFATGVCGLVDLKCRTLHLTGAGGPAPVVFHADGTVDTPDCSGSPFGMVRDASYDQTAIALANGDCVLFFSDGAVEIRNIAREELGVAGLVGLLKSRRYPTIKFPAKSMDLQLLKYSNALQLPDDVTFLEIRV